MSTWRTIPPDTVLPALLDGIITRKRDEVSLGLATQGEVRRLLGPIEPDQDPILALSVWRLVALRVAANEEAARFASTHPHLLGQPADGLPVLSEALFGLDLDGGRAMTQRGEIVTLLGEHAPGEPPSDHLQAVCAALASWGLAEALGVSEVAPAP